MSGEKGRVGPSVCPVECLWSLPSIWLSIIRLLLGLVLGCGILFESWIQARFCQKVCVVSRAENVSLMTLVSLCPNFVGLLTAICGSIWFLMYLSIWINGMNYEKDTLFFFFWEFHGVPVNTQCFQSSEDLSEARSAPTCSHTSDSHKCKNNQQPLNKCMAANTTYLLSGVLPTKRSEGCSGTTYLQPSTLACHPSQECPIQSNPIHFIYVAQF